MPPSMPHRRTPTELRALLQQQGLRRGYWIWDAEQRRVRASHPALAPLGRWLEEGCSDFDGHEGFFIELGRQSQALLGACVHRSVRGQGAGGVRLWPYESVAALLRDGLRLSRGMTHKNALAELWWGGGKGVVAREDDRPLRDPAARRLIYKDYGDFITGLRGCYVTAEDAGTRVDDMAAVFTRTRFTTCIPAALGGSGNPSVPTARGVVQGMRAALDHLGKGPLAGRRVAVQGLGHVGTALVGFLLEAGVAGIIGGDIDGARIAALRETWRDAPITLHHIGGDAMASAVLAADVDIFAPCAGGGGLHADSIAQLRAPIVCGAANNQLAEPADDARLAAAGITYVPDFLVNRMGIVTCADEQAGYLHPDPAIERHLGREWDNSIYNLTRRVLADAEAQGQPPGAVALALAEERSRVPHPIWGHRGAAIIRGLVADGWVDG